MQGRLSIKKKDVTAGTLHKVTVVKSAVISELELACLQMLLGACSIVPLDSAEEQIPSHLYAQLLHSMLVATTTSSESDADLAIITESKVNSLVEEDFPQGQGWLTEDDEEVFPVSKVLERLKARWASWCSASSAPHRNHPGDHGLVEVVEHVLCYEVGGTLGLYSDQLESIHAEMCDACLVAPIVGFLYEEVVTEAARGPSEGEDRGGGGGGGVSKAEPMRFCQSCMSSKSWMKAWDTVKRSNASTSDLQDVPANRRARVQQQIAAATIVKIKRTPGEVLSNYDTITGRIALNTPVSTMMGS